MWDCYHVEDDGTVVQCPWRENHWKYEEVQRFLLLAKAQRGGLDLNRLNSLGFVAFLKVDILRQHLEV